jgi:hypothetical protein
MLVDPAHRDTQLLGDLLDREVAAHQGPPGTAAKRGRAPAGGSGPRAGRTTVHSSASAMPSLVASAASSWSSRAARTMPPAQALLPEQPTGRQATRRRRPGSSMPARPTIHAPRRRRARPTSATSAARCTATLVAGWNRMARSSQSLIDWAVKPMVRPFRESGCGSATRRRNVVSSRPNSDRSEWHTGGSPTRADNAAAIQAGAPHRQPHGPPSDAG